MSETPNTTFYETLINPALTVEITQYDFRCPIYTRNPGTLEPGEYIVIPRNGSCIGLINCILMPLALRINSHWGSYLALSYLPSPHQLRNDVPGYSGFWTDACFPETVDKPVMIPTYSSLGKQLMEIANGNSV